MSVQVLESDLVSFDTENALSLKDKLQTALEIASSLAVVDDPSFRKMTAFYADSKEWEKRVEFLRKQANAPDQERINARNDKAKEILAPLKQVQMIAKQKCEQYQLLIERQRQEEEEKLQKAFDLIGINEAPIIEAEKSTRGDGAMMYTRTIRKFRIVDLTKVPMKYLQLNEDMVNRELKLGISEIPGLEVYDETVTQLRTR